MGQTLKHLAIAFLVMKWKQGEDTSKILVKVLSMRTEMFCIQRGKDGNLYAWSHLLVPRGYMFLNTGSCALIYSTRKGRIYKNNIIVRLIYTHSIILPFAIGNWFGVLYLKQQRPIGCSEFQVKYDPQKHKVLKEY